MYLLLVPVFLSEIVLNCRIEELESRVPGLSEGKWYQFRVIAVNKAGDSPPSLETKPHLCRHKNREIPLFFK